MSAERAVYCSWILFLLLSPVNIRADEFGLFQTKPKNRTVCPGETLQYTCTSPLIQQYWTIGTSYPFIITESSMVNSSGTIGDFFLILAQKDASCSTCTATNDLVTSIYDGVQIACYSGNMLSTIKIAVADKPADCSSMYVFPTCRATTNAKDEADFSVTLSSSQSLDCVVGYQIHFNGESENVSLSSPTAQFSFSYGGGQPVQNEIVVYTLDYETRTGENPCTFSIVELNAVEEFLEPECIFRSSQNVDITFRWEPAVVGGCLEGSAQLRYNVELNDSRFSNGQESNPNRTVTNIMKETVLKITVSPSLPLLRLTGPPLSETVNLANVSCSPGSSEEVTPATSPMSMTSLEPSLFPGDIAKAAASQVHDHQTVSNAVTVLLAVLMVAA